MVSNTLVPAVRQSFAWHEDRIPVRGCRFSLDSIKEFAKDILAINMKMGEQVIGSLECDEDLTDEEWDMRKEKLKNDAFCLTITVNGFNDRKLYSETVDVFDDPELPKPIRSIYFTNINSFRRNANEVLPKNRVEVFLDFGKPDLLDPSPLLSEATPNVSNVKIHAEDITFFNAVQHSVQKKLNSRKAWYGSLHRNFAYDLGLWFLAAPTALYFSTYYMDQLIPVGDKLEVFRWPLFIYFMGLCLILYRVLNSYAKWAFPVNSLDENQDRALRHRVALGGFGSWLVYSLGSTVYDIIVSASS
ncbi:MAG: hypothetical protein ABJO52_16955 [Nisaea sp.]|uniref:hypothetical protein n=1 Tax=Alphaproteobacteria TaxID=28211 RepID=UPI003297B2E8